MTKKEHKDLMEMVIFNKKCNTIFLSKSFDSYNLIYGSSKIIPFDFILSSTIGSLIMEVLAVIEHKTQFQ